MSNPKFCDECGNKLEDGWKLCPHCGKNLEVSTSILQPLTPLETKTSNLRGKLSLLPILSGILTLISLMFPAAYSTVKTPIFEVKITSYLYVWGFVYSIRGFETIEKDGFFNGAFTIAFVILLLGCIIIGLSKLFLDNKLKSEYLKRISLLIGIFQLVLVFGWILYLDLVFPGIWSVYTIHFGLIGLILSAILLIITSVVFEIYKDKIPDKIKEKQKEENEIIEKKPYEPKRTDFVLFGVLGFFIVLIIVVIIIVLIS